MQTKNPEKNNIIPDSDIFEGMVSVRAVFDGIERGVTNRKLLRLLFAESHVKGNGKLLGFLKARSFAYGYSLEVVPDCEIDSLAIGSSHGGVLLITEKRCFPTEIKPIQNGFYVLLEGIEDPFNLGYAIRSAYAAGADGIILPKHNAMQSAGIVCRSSAGASEQLPIYIGDVADTVSPLRRMGYHLVCADMDAPAPAHLADLKKPIILAVGGERRGFDKKLLALSDLTVRLDYGRDFPMALSAASAAAILCFEVTKQNLLSYERK